MNFITSYKFARTCKHVFSEDLLQSQFENLNKEGLLVIEKNGNRISYINTKFQIKSGDTVFCKSDNLDILFETIKKYPEVNRLTLLSSQDDLNISQKIYKKLPENFDYWFAINCDINSEKLIPIPLGVANYYDKNLNINIFEKAKFIESYYSKKENLLYISFNKNTNIKVREPILKYFKNKPWVKYSNNNSLDQYFDDLKASSFVFCPVGNGIDTHRIWETLYAGAIPIVEKNIHYLSFQSLPIFFYEDISEVTERALLNFIKKRKKYNLEKLNFDYWKNKLISENANNNLSTVVYISRKTIMRFLLKRTINKTYVHISKKIKFRLRQIIKSIMKFTVK